MGIFSSLFGPGGASDNAAALNEINKIPLPVLKEYYPELYKQVVALNPELETAVNLGPSAMEGVSTDPALKQAQLNALMKLQGVAEQGGMNFEDKSRLNQIQTDINSNLQGNEGAIQQNMAARGMSGGGSEMVARQMAAQQASNRQAQMGMDVKAQAERRALEAMMQTGQLAGQMDSQQFGQQTQVASAKDSINKFNSANQQQVQSNNVNAKNNAQQINAANTQGIANQNTGANNQAQQYNLGLAQQQYDNQMKKAGALAGAHQNNAAQANADRQGEAALWGGLITAGATYAGGRK